MGRESLSQIHFRKKTRHEREQRGWSQAELAKMLTAKGIDNMYPTTVAKIESGDREVKLDEATAIADLLEMSLDALVARHSRKRQEDETTYYLRELRDNARRYSGQVSQLSCSVDGDVSNVSIDGVPEDITEDWKEISDRADRAVYDLQTVAYDLNEIANDATEILSRRLGKGGTQ